MNTIRITMDQLNRTAALLGTTDKRAVYAAVIKTLMSDGYSLPQAYDALYGDDAYDTLVETLHAKLRGE